MKENKTENSYPNIIEELKRSSNDAYRIFNSKIVPTKQQMLGVCLPALRTTAKRIAKESPLTFMRHDKKNIYEMVLLEGLVIAYMDGSLMEKINFLELFLDKVDNWAHIDSVACTLKVPKTDKKDVLNVIKKWLDSDKEFFIRMGVVMLLNYYVDEENLEMLFSFSQNIDNSPYYVHMANAWLISVCMAKYPTRTIVFFKHNTLDAKTHNRAIQKSCESYRVSKEHKATIRLLKR